MHFDFSSIDKIVEKHSDRLVNMAKELNWKVINTHKKAYFDNFQNTVKEGNLWRGNPDTFKIAACLLASLIEEKVLYIEVKENLPPEVVLYNYRLAVNVALEFLSTTQIHTYTANRYGDFVVEQDHPTVKLAFPAGIIEAEEMYISYCKSLASADLRGHPVYLSTHAIVLHLLYCYCSEKEEKQNALSDK